ncbi:MAG: aldo/keto reductase [Rhodospirillales bacterium]|jgi:aryl-alcohol dehydrogenase-like predicted oxidoreductase|nr:aldo/keto reductase [Rhodospirillaceae bacterium]MDP6427007.1 aldo/keto reductase [Rhodospirillales bacterium]MDP6643649.1 aldo/keto reductase [Rhodospirillales bacterium]MDP6840252.1 aldo/keto reductase [Rhodospirillales bacterium]
MERIALGRTNLEVSVAGLGAGGGVQLGLRNGANEDQAAGIVRLAFDQGINLFDTAKGYGTEGVVAAGLKGIPRDQYVISTKHSVDRQDRTLITVDQVLAGLDNSLRALGTDCIDIYQLHGIDPVNYAHATKTVMPALLKEREKGKFRFLGATEFAQRDLDHLALAQGMDEDLFDVIMLAFSMVNQNARLSVFPRAMASDIGTLIMFASRNLFGYPERLKRELGKLAGQGELPDWLAGEAEPLEFLIHEAGAENLVDAAYRYARDEAGAHVVLFGTGNPSHLRANVDYLSRPPLPAADRAKLEQLFGKLVGFGVEPGMTHAQIETDLAGASP